MLAELFDNQGGLHGKLSDWDQDESLDLVQAGVNFVDQRNTIRCSLASTILGLSDDVFAGLNLRNGLLLDW